MSLLVCVLLFLYCLTLCMLMVVILLGMFLVNYVPALLLFDSGASRLFVSTSFDRGFSVPREPLDRSLRVAILEEHMISAFGVYRGCVLEIFGVEFLIDLIPITIVMYLLLWVWIG